MIDIYPSDVIIVVYEGNSEKYILELLLEQEAFIFESWQLLDGQLFKRSNSQHREALESQYFPMDFGNSRLVLFLIQDDDATMKIDDVFLDKITGPIFIVTKPEIEMLMIHSLDCYEDFHKARVQNHQLKPSQFVAGKMNISTSRVKSKEFIQAFYEEHSLVDSILSHSGKANHERGKYLLADIIK